MPESDGPDSGNSSGGDGSGGNRSEGAVSPAAGNAAAAEAETGASAGEASDRLSVLTHELGGLLDGSLRWLGLVSRSLGAGDEAERVRGQLDTVQESLLRMGELVRTASGVKGPRFAYGGFGPGPSVAEAASHAIDVVRPRCSELGITLGLEMGEGSGRSPSGPLYSVLLNGLRNAIESIEQAIGGQPGEGVIVLRVRDEQADGGRVVVIEIEDDGIGPPEAGYERIFEPGFTTRAGAGGGRGIGLALSKQIVDEIGGSLELLGADGSDRRPGARLVVRVPAVSGEMPSDEVGAGPGEEGAA
ncbi:MAG: ATP-binding protein [Planctomycetota bacterium]